MSTWMKKLKMIAVAALCVLGIAGCSAGSTVVTKLTLNQDLSGVRAMDVAIDSKVFAENFHGDINALNEVVQKNCPKDLVWNYDNSDGTDRYHVELAFSSPEDYKKKVEAIVGKEVKLEMSAPETVWANGFRVYENFTSTDLLEWLKNVLVEGGLVNSSDASYVFESGATQLVFGEKVFDAGNRIQVNELEYLPLEKIDLLTNIKDSNSFDRSVIFYIPKESMNAKKTEIEAYLNGNVPDGADSSWETYENGSKMTITKENMDVSGLSAFSQKVLDSDQNLVGTEKKQVEEGIFGFADLWSETINLSSYAGNESGTVRMGYYLKYGDGMELKRDPDAGLVFHLREDETYPSYQSAASDKIAETVIQFRMEKNYMIQNTKVTTEAKNTDSFVRITEFILKQVPSDDEQSQILKRLQDRTGEVEGTTISAVTGEDGYYAVTVEQKGNSKQLAESSQAVFGSSVSVGKAEDTGLMAFNHKTGFHERFNYSDFAGTVPEDYVLTYTAKMGILERVNKKSLSDGSTEGMTVSVKGGTVTCETSDNEMQIAFSGSKVNFIGILLWIVILAAAGFLGWKWKTTGLFGMVKEDLMNWQEQRKQRAGERQAAGLGAQPGAADSQPGAQPGPVVLQKGMEPLSGTGTTDSQSGQMEAAATVAAGLETRFCPECGTPCAPGSLFCENCGVKLD